MKLFYTQRFEQSYEEAPANVKRAFAKQAQFLAANLRHPSLKAKKYDVANNTRSLDYFRKARNAGAHSQSSRLPRSLARSRCGGAPKSFL